MIHNTKFGSARMERSKPKKKQLAQASRHIQAHPCYWVPQGDSFVVLQGAACQAKVADSIEGLIYCSGENKPSSQNTLLLRV